MRLVPSLVEFVLTNGFDRVVPRAAEFPARGKEASPAQARSLRECGKGLRVTEAKEEVEGQSQMQWVPSLVEFVLTNEFDWVAPRAAEFPARGNEASPAQARSLRECGRGLRVTEAKEEVEGRVRCNWCRAWSNSF
jgi:cell pole-organizing protein PopZ